MSWNSGSMNGFGYERGDGIAMAEQQSDLAARLEDELLSPCPGGCGKDSLSCECR